ncbi:hypothetical protein PFICI_10693 [Pestalotiopsis fici W106-1]|uniref:Uncharacterized protein n=1 Tax=Pestalotiopsis fici (strain W106-1 / CGMCC3.15140) TaxID=1229662 RepID=W3X0G7_PESFW|nr:uncharacterized protein PFICI_10693 [Pestalotiopsis fici W106-1]ETS78631.1 hypothetical protein PFICI_10693 [Pestalotiopsis fici W106-1]
MTAQSISNRYIKLEDLRSLLQSKFGAGNFKIREEDESYEIEVPSILSESEIKSIQKY